MCRENSSFIKIQHEWLVLYKKTNIHFSSYLSKFFLEREIFQAKVVEKIKTHIIRSITFFENRAVYEVMWKNTVDPGRPQMTICLLRISCWVTKAKNTQSAYVTLIAFPLRQLFHKRASVLHSCLVYFGNEECAAFPLHVITLLLWAAIFSSGSLIFIMKCAQV